MHNTQATKTTTEMLGIISGKFRRVWKAVYKNDIVAVKGICKKIKISY